MFIKNIFMKHKKETEETEEKMTRLSDFLPLLSSFTAIEVYCNDEMIYNGFSSKANYNIDIERQKKMFITDVSLGKCGRNNENPIMIIKTKAKKVTYKVDEVVKKLENEMVYCSGYPFCSEFDYAYEIAVKDMRKKAIKIIQGGIEDED